ncbi:agmatine deiminase family protein [Streptomyces sp. NPDC003863]
MGRQAGARTSPTRTWTVSYGSPHPARSCSTRLSGRSPDSWPRSADQARSALGEAADARGRRFEIIGLPQPDLDRITGEGDDFVSTHAGFYIANDSVFLPEFGDRTADDRARAVLQDHFPKREVVRLRIDTIASGGGIHCATHEQPGNLPPDRHHRPDRWRPERP